MSADLHGSDKFGKANCKPKVLRAWFFLAFSFQAAVSGSATQAKLGALDLLRLAKDPQELVWLWRDYDSGKKEQTRNRMRMSALNRHFRIMLVDRDSDQ
jgi:hypothetical protein